LARRSISSSRNVSINLLDIAFAMDPNVLLVYLR
jgi:hypothetical protein